jgi:hypothetical protein
MTRPTEARSPADLAPIASAPAGASGLETGGVLARATANPRARRAAAFGCVALVATGGWGWGAFEHFVRVPAAQETQRIAYTLDLVDRFYEMPAHDAYMRLSDDLKPWWSTIEPIQREIAAAKDDETRNALIAKRDASLDAFIREKGLAPRIDLLVQSFDQFTRCLGLKICDENILRGAISIDVKRIYRTFRPYILKRREGTLVEDKEFGRDLEDLFFRFG